MWVRSARANTGSRRWLVLTLGLLAGGCAFAGTAVEHEVAHKQDLSQLRQELSLQLQRSREQAERQSREQAAEIQKQLASLQSRAEGLTAELATLGGRVEEFSQRLESLSRQARAAPPAAAPPRPAPPAPPRAPQTLQPSDLYQTAYLDFSKGNYPLAIAGFREFLRRFPDAELANNAQYWIGEAYFSLARSYAAQGQPAKTTEHLEKAVQEFRKVILNYPRGEKAPTALYKEALALVELKQPGLAQERLRYLLEHFPRSEEAPLARDRLAALKKE
jgi:tol-pal system protein YbgF